MRNFIQVLWLYRTLNKSRIEAEESAHMAIEKYTYNYISNPAGLPEEQKEKARQLNCELYREKLEAIKEASQIQSQLDKLIDSHFFLQWGFLLGAAAVLAIVVVLVIVF
ncbi:hypothetical protein VCR15J2_390048 [Vibrio coralliirubri]|uniref:hypothetical protein n=1 Tax=Vibrio coralliirubri TaxID=1516159 RepID=UPI000632BDD1|nr:hypothetical protein [Vibrio coralliirubri]CDT53143.1 hypothetical protein VCR15J2_390048 [Vibrio coralliirubri]